LTAGLISACVATAAWAHKINVFANVQDRTIHGEAYFQDGIPLRNVPVTVFAPNGATLGELTTDDAGKFHYQPRWRCAHRVVVDAGMGHVAEYVVPQEELPEDLPSGEVSELPADGAPVSSQVSGNVVHEHAADEHADEHEPAESDSAVIRDGSDTSEIRALNRQVAALRADLERWKSRLRIQDIMGGIGYILGILGVLSYFLARRGQREMTPLER
jgi:hypothetical protein